ncbi:hypothetical protein [Micromonospora sp. NPDC126480]|uniref:hypothetical protein n=1 Tax=Micromonospora sp. NPDC126480 TaxID=3155312 RepID=UPI00331D6514
MTRLSGRVGAHLIGVPVIFLRSDVLSRLDPQAWPVHGTTGQHPEPDRLGALATIHHEIRHFHDALLTPFLFHRFLLEVQRNAIGGRVLASAFARGSTPQADMLNDEERELVARHRRDVREHRRVFADCYATATVDWLGALSVSDLLEANAVVTEYQALAPLLGEELLARRWTEWSGTVPTKYTAVVNRLMVPGEPFTRNLRRINRVLMWCLYGAESPLRRFTAATNCAWPGLLDRLCGAPAIERSLRAALRRERYEVWQLGDDEATARYYLGARDLVDYRRQYEEALRGADFRLDGYVESLAATPVPPTCFYADDDMVRTRRVPFVRKADLRTAYGDAYVLGLMRDAARRTTLSAGIIPTPGHRSCVALNRVDTMLAMRYLTQEIFGDQVTYSTLLDNLYDGYLSELIASGRQRSATAHPDRR